MNVLNASKWILLISSLFVAQVISDDYSIAGDENYDASGEGDGDGDEDSGINENSDLVESTTAAATESSTEFIVAIILAVVLFIIMVVSLILMIWCIRRYRFKKIELMKAPQPLNNKTAADGGALDSTRFGTAQKAQPYPLQSKPKLQQNNQMKNDARKIPDHQIPGKQPAHGLAGAAAAPVNAKVSREEMVNRDILA